MKSFIHGIFLLFTAFLALAGITATAQPTPGFPTLPADHPPNTGQLVPCLDDAEGKVECGRFRVFEDRAAGRGRTLDLAFIVARALDPEAEARDALTFFLGGPGSSPTGQAQGLMGLFREVRKQRDLLFLDFRGAGASEALSCDVPYPKGVVSRFEELFPVDHLQACVRKLQQRAKLDLYTSSASMDDLEDLRKWLGYLALNLWTGSYGAREAQIFLRRHPETVRTIVLNAPSPVFHKAYLSHARGLQDALDRLVAECAVNADCHAGYPDLEAELQSVLKRVKTVICAESIGFITDEEVRVQTADTFLGDFLIEAYRDACRAWPAARLPESFLEPVKSRVPTLILSGERDPVTPPSKGEAIAAVLENSRHVVIPNGGHGVFGDCYQAMVRKLIETASLADLDESCVTASEPTEFRAPASPQGKS